MIEDIWQTTHKKKQMQQEFYALAAFFMFYKIANYIYCT